MKKFIALIVIVLIFLAVGYIAYKWHKKTSQSKMITSQIQPTAKTQNLFTSIQDALANKALSIQCNYTDDQGNHTLVYIKAGAIRADVTDQQSVTNSVLIKEKKIYFWPNGKTEGMIIDMPEVTPVQPTGTIQTANTPQNPSTDVMDSLEKFKDRCKVATIQDDLFAPPSNVTFRDISKMMPPKGAIPPVTGMPSINPSNYQQMMQQYGQPQ